MKEYTRRTQRWKGKPVTAYYRHVHRRQADDAMERTLIGAIVPPGPGHIDSILSTLFANLGNLVIFSAICASMPVDFFVKSTGKGTVGKDLLEALPVVDTDSAYAGRLASRVLRLNCLTNAYSVLWSATYSLVVSTDTWSASDPRLGGWDHLDGTWHHNYPLRKPFERRQALLEIDVLAAMALDLTLEELETIYRVQFPVLQKYDRRLRFDQRGRVVPVKTVQGELGIDQEAEGFEAFVPPFTEVDRVADYRRAWVHFRRVLAQEPRP